VIEGDPLVPKPGYRLDESDPNVLVLRRQDSAFVAAFSACGATREVHPTSWKGRSPKSACTILA